MTDTAPTLPTTKEEREHVAATIAAILNDLQPRRAAAMRTAAAQVKSALAGTWFADAIAIPPAEDDWEQTVAPHVDVIGGLTTAFPMDLDMWESFRLFPSKVPATSSLFVAFTIDRLCPGAGASRLPEIEDWNLVHDFGGTFIPRVTEALGDRWSAAVRSLNKIQGLEHQTGHFFQILVNAPNHRFWRGGTLMLPTTALNAAFSAYSDELRGYVGRVLYEIIEHIDPSDEAILSLRVRLLWIRSVLPSSFLGDVSASTNFIWARIVGGLMADRNSTADENVVTDAIIECFPVASPAVGRYLEMLDARPDLRPVPPTLSLNDLYDQTIIDWEASLEPGQLPCEPDKESRLDESARTAFRLGAPAAKAAF